MKKYRMIRAPEQSSSSLKEKRKESQGKT